MGTPDPANPAEQSVCAKAIKVTENTLRAVNLHVMASLALVVLMALAITGNNHFISGTMFHRSPLTLSVINQWVLVPTLRTPDLVDKFAASIVEVTKFTVRGIPFDRSSRHGSEPSSFGINLNRSIIIP